jgi:lysyl-tRNA synthetase class II
MRSWSEIKKHIKMNIELSEQEIIRRQSLNELRNLGIDPYPADEYPVNAFSTDIKADFQDDAPQWQVCIAGRIMSRRIMGKASFIELQDSKGRIQVYITSKDLAPLNPPGRGKLCEVQSSKNSDNSTTANPANQIAHSTSSFLLYQGSSAK